MDLTDGWSSAVAVWMMIFEQAISALSLFPPSSSAHIVLERGLDDELVAVQAANDRLDAQRPQLLGLVLSTRERGDRVLVRLEQRLQERAADAAGMLRQLRCGGAELDGGSQPDSEHEDGGLGGGHCLLKSLDD